MQPLTLLVGYVWAAVALALGKTLVAFLFAVLTATVIATLRAYDEARYG